MANAKELFKKAYSAVRKAVKEERMIGFNEYGQVGVSCGGFHEAYSAAHGGFFHDERLLEAAKAAAKAFGERAIAAYKKPVPVIERMAANEEWDDCEAYEYI